MPSVNLLDFQNILNNPQSVFEVDIFENIKYQGYIYIDNKDLDGALDFANFLGQLIKNISPGNRDQREIYEALQFWNLRLMVFGFDNLDVKDQTELLKDQIDTILGNGIDILSAVSKSIYKFQSVDVINDLAKTYLNSVLVSKKIIGENVSAKAEKFFSPTVGNWIKEYQESVNKRGVSIESGRFDIVTFMNNNYNVRFLSADEKEILQDLLSFYNWLSKPYVLMSDKEQSFSAPKVLNTNYIQTSKFILPKQFSPNGEKSKLSVEQNSFGVQEPNAGSNIPSAVTKPKINLGGQINTQLPKMSPGLNYGGLKQQTNTATDDEVTKIKQEIESKKSQAQAAIDKKLLSLKKKLDK